MIGYIYILRCPLNNDIKYVGLSRNPTKRKSQHRCYSEKMYKNSRYNSWKDRLKSMSMRPIFEIIEQIDIIDMSDREKYWISYYRNIGVDLYNLTIGGENMLLSENHNSKYLKGKKLEDYYGHDVAKLIREKTSKSLQGNKNPNFNGVNCTATWRKNQSISQSKKHLLLYEGTLLIGEFINSKEIAKFLNCSDSTIRESKRNGYLIKKKYRVIDLV